MVEEGDLRPPRNHPRTRNLGSDELDSQPLRNLVATDSADHVRVSDDHKYVGRARHADVQPLPRAIAFT